MVSPLTPYGLSAVLWDQGENNAQYCTEPQYSCLFTSMVNNWRAAFDAPTLPIAWVQIGGYAMDNKDGVSANAVIRLYAPLFTPARLSFTNKDAFVYRTNAGST